MLKYRRKRERRVTTDTANTGRFRCVSIVLRPPVCKKAREMAGKRILLNEAPTLPLPGCTAPKCGCKFRNHDDRRSDTRRSSDLGITASFYVGPERRRGAERRKDDEGAYDPSYYDYFRQ